LVFEPLPRLSFSADYWQLKIKNLVSGLPEQEVFANSAKYASRFVRCSQVAAGAVPGVQISDIDACTSLSATLDPIAFIDTPTENLGELRVSGLDLSANWRSQATEYGAFGVSAEGTYLTKYDYQRERGGAFIDAIGRYSDNAPVFRWQHVLSLSWNLGDWSASLTQRFKSGYTDQDGVNKVGRYTLHDMSVTWTGVKNLTLSAGIMNLFDKDPPRSVQNTTFQRGFDPRFTDPLGRTFLVRAAYKFE
jgi:iron complex outermembrane recepter protein